MAPLANAAAFSSMSHFFRNPIMPAAQNLWLLTGLDPRRSSAPTDRDESPFAAGTLKPEVGEASL
jgi:hypothetical protein